MTIKIAATRSPTSSVWRLGPEHDRTGADGQLAAATDLGTSLLDVRGRPRMRAAPHVSLERRT
jgi:hypothetical protein